jgi:hypothetical protein
VVILTAEVILTGPAVYTKISQFFKPLEGLGTICANYPKLNNALQNGWKKEHIPPWYFFSKSCLFEGMVQRDLTGVKSGIIP